MMKTKKLKKKTSVSSFFFFFFFFFYASFCVMKTAEAHWKIADGLIISEVGTRATCLDGTSYFEIFMAQEGKIDLAGYTIQADEEVIFTFSDFTKPIEAGEARVVCTGDSSEDIWYSIPPTAGTITAGKTYKLVSKEGVVVDESGVVEEGTVGTANEFYSWQRQRTPASSPTLEGIANAAADTADSTRREDGCSGTHCRVQNEPHDQDADA